MKKYAFLLNFILCFVFVSAQEVISTQGDFFSNSNGSIEYTIGEVVIFTGADGTSNITQGFHQSIWNVVGIEDYYLNYKATVFPNPINEELNIEVSNFKNLSYILIDAQGKTLLKAKITAEQTSIQVSELVAGNYSLILMKSGQNIKSFKLVKTK